MHPIQVFLHMDNIIVEPGPSIYIQQLNKLTQLCFTHYET